MIITCLSFKGGVAKTTTAVHIAGALQLHAPTVLVDGDSIRSALTWAEEGKLPFKVVPDQQLGKVARAYEHVVIDTPARPDSEDIKDLADGCDLLVLPTVPDALPLSALLLSTDALKEIGAERFRILLTIVPPYPSKDAQEARVTLQESELPTFTSQIRRSTAFRDAVLAGSLVRDVPHRNAADCWREYLAVVKEILP